MGVRKELPEGVGGSGVEVGNTVGVTPKGGEGDVTLEGESVRSAVEVGEKEGDAETLDERPPLLVFEGDPEGLLEAEGERLSFKLAVSVTVPVPGKIPEGEAGTEGVATLEMDPTPDLVCIPPVGVGGASEGVKNEVGVPTDVLEAVEQAVLAPPGEKDGTTVMEAVTEAVEEWEKEGEAEGGIVEEGCVEEDMEVINEPDPKKLALPALESVPTPTPPHEPVLRGRVGEGVAERVPPPRP